MADGVAKTIYSDWRVNGAFLDNTFQDALFRLCLANFLAPAFQCPLQKVPPCVTFGDALSEAMYGGIDHVSTADVEALREDVGLGLGLAGIPTAQQEAAKSALDGEVDLIKDLENDGSAYQRMGGQTALRTMVAAGLAEAKQSNELSAYFAGVADERYVACFARLISDRLGAAMTYADESSLEGLFPTPCREIASFHSGVTHDAFLDFVAVMMKHAPGPEADVLELHGVLMGLCEAIVDDKNACGDNSQEIVLKKTGDYPILKGPSEVCVTFSGKSSDNAMEIDPKLTMIRGVKAVSVGMNHPRVGHLSIAARAPSRPLASAELMSKPGPLPDGFPANLDQSEYLVFIEDALCDYAGVGAATPDDKAVCSADDPSECECSFKPKQPLSWLTPGPVPMDAEWNICVQNASLSSYGNIVGAELLVTATKY
ncbi:hypothetical protein [Nannocystis pusilla]|uniref:hypothetical protein n=1 Tax=Nannocystis pusilla TaxID=889268 RepID=UPI003BF5F23B